MDRDKSITTFIGNVGSSLDYKPTAEELSDVCDQLLKEHTQMSSIGIAAAIKSITFYCLDKRLNGEIRQGCLECIKAVMNAEVWAILAEDLRAMLIQLRNKQISAAGRLKGSNTLTLRPTKGFSLQEDKVRNAWQENGGKRSIPLFYVVLAHIEHRNISSNLWWVTPGILNLMDDTTDLEGIKLQGVVLLRQFLTESIDLTDANHFDFANTGLFEIFDSSLKSLWYHFPPSTEPILTAKIWDLVFSTYIPLCKAQFAKDCASYDLHVSQFMSEILLQATLPRIAADYKDLTVQVLQYMDTIFDILGPKSVVHLQRVIFNIGEHIIRNAFITLFMPLVHQVLSTLTHLVSVCPEERIVAHKYDLLACALILSEKCRLEGTLDGRTSAHLRKFLQALQQNGCIWDTEERQKLTSMVAHSFELP
ncbi:Tti2p [Lachancea thermotolerans CBS 6340]|uniref:KLTH0D17578p n=1 Tax=Lachancea thermotolerans (strain ATCC 56472 / CBS 6340 / NRRL Y-8284) TaxID=559295 RepID=C5DFS7_LACTC|nr:KLTH0D17578p [Lachancea thermotolerans CBS 6340]CAR23032.1 KLTH0D17578p [Lachancea thermotolerans CBS 6340]